MEIILSLTDKFGRIISLTKERHLHIVSRPEMTKQESKIKETLIKPDEVRESLRDKSTLLYFIRNI